MKKYIKPELYYEEFQMSQSVAACGWNLEFQDVNSCAAVGDMDFGNLPITLFQGHCDVSPEILAVTDKDYQSYFYCYMTGALNDATKVLQS